MRFENTTISRNLELFHIIVNRTSTEDEIKELFKLSDYEFKNDFKTISKLAEYYGIKLIKENSLISYKTVNQNLFTKKFKYCNAFYMKHINNINSKFLSFSQYFIALDLLQSKYGVNIDRIAEVLGYSRSNIRDSVKSARYFVENYNIQIKNSPKIGLITQGSEFNRRLALIALSSFLERGLFLNSFLVDDFLYNDELNIQLRSRLFAFLEFSKISVSAVSLKLLIRYLEVQSIRIRDKEYIQYFDFEIDDKIINSYEYSVSKQIFYEFIDFDDTLSFEMEKREITSLTVLLACYSELLSNPPKNSLFILYKLESQVELVKINLLNFLTETWHLTIVNPSSNIIFHSEIAKILMLNHFNMASFRHLSFGNQRNNIREYPLVLAVGQSIRRFLQANYGITSSLTPIFDICEIIHYNINLLPINFVKPNIVISTRDSISKSYLYRDLIRESIPIDMYNQIYTCNFSKIESQFKEKNNVLVVDTITSKLLDRTNLFKPEKELHVAIELNNFLTDKKRLSKPIFDEVVSEKKEYMTQSINDQLKILAKSHNRIFDSSSIYINHSHEILIGIDNSCDKCRSVFHLTQLENPYLYRDNKFATIVLLVINKEINLKYLNYFLHILINNNVFLDELSHNPKDEVIENYINSRIIG